MNVQESKLPFASAAQDVATGLPSKVRAMGLFGAKPWPLTAWLLPTVPLVALTLMLGLTVKVAETPFVKVLSSAVRVWAPATVSGTMKGQRKPPFASLVHGGPWALSSSKPKAMGLCGAKPLPMTTSRLSAAPAGSCRLIAVLTE
jgi:hypothetical protein